MLFHVIKRFIILGYLFKTVLADSGYTVKITNDGPVVSGAVMNFTATLYYYGKPESGSYQYVWRDDTYPRHLRTIDSESPYDTWSIDYNAEDYSSGSYMMQLEVYKYTMVLFTKKIAQGYVIFSLTETLHGDFELKQNNQLITNEYVSNNSTVIHKVLLNKPDADYLNKTATSILTYWFIDCKYLGVTDDFSYRMNYTEAGKLHNIEALVLPDFTPLPPPTTTTTTTTTPPPNTSTTTTTTTTTKPITKKPNNTNLQDHNDDAVSPIITNINSKLKHKREASNNDIVAKFKGHFISISGTKTINDSFPYVCSNNTVVPLSSNQTYGYFMRTINVKQPVNEVKVDGNNWIQRYDMLKLNVTCKGSSTFKYCHTFKDGIYNVTGNETCVDYNTSEKCEFPIQRLFILNNADVHTVIIVIYNEVSKIVFPVTVNIYKVNKQAQLSVIVVPVAFSLVAVVLIVFGVAYYIQNRSRFTVEVADFNFGQQYADMEYKSFKERLRDSISNAFTRAPLPGSSEGPVWPPGRKYGSMT